jgi:hypothetical protein
MCLDCSCGEHRRRAVKRLPDHLQRRSPERKRRRAGQTYYNDTRAWRVPTRRFTREHTNLSATGAQERPFASDEGKTARAGTKAQADIPIEAHYNNATFRPYSATADVPIDGERGSDRLTTPRAWAAAQCSAAHHSLDETG